MVCTSVEFKHDGVDRTRRIAISNSTVKIECSNSVEDDDNHECTAQMSDSLDRVARQSDSADSLIMIMISWFRDDNRVVVTIVDKQTTVYLTDI